MSLGALVPDLTVQPTRKWIRIQYWIAFIVFCVSVGLYVNLLIKHLPAWVLIVPALLFLLPIRGQLRRRFTRLTLSGDKLRYECGVFSKTMRTIPVSKIQDVRADQTFTQRLMGTGNLTIETAGEAGGLTIGDIDDPQDVVDNILDAQGPAPKPKGGERG
jgi:uncharacterized membrane protein YdbT with pleckstrin-like domain